jgi:drug/metabolite transporter (DMT)-like permease
MKAVLLLVLTAFLWSTSGLFIKYVRWNAPAIAGTRSGIAALFIILAGRVPRFSAMMRNPKRESRGSGAEGRLSRILFPLLGGLAYACTVVLFVIATRLTTAANAILLQYTAPAWVALFGAWFLKERATSLDWLIIAAVFGGLVLFFFDHFDTRGFWGNVLAIASGFTYAWMILLLRRQKRSPLASIIIGNLMAAAFCAPFIRAPWPDLAGWLALLYLGTVQLGFSYLLYTYAIRHVLAIEAILIPTLEPLLNPLWVFLFLGEIPGSWSILGGLVVLSALTYRSYRMVRRSRG